MDPSQQHSITMDKQKSLNEPLETPTKELDAFANSQYPSVPLDTIEQPKKTRFNQLLAVIVAGVALFSDGYNIQVTGE